MASSLLYFSGLVVTAVAAAGAVAAYFQTRRQADVAAAALRPWISVTPVLEGPFSLSPARSELHFGFRVHNQGNSPALDVAVDQEFRAYPISDAAPSEEDLTCRLSKTRDGYTTGRLVFPGGDADQHGRTQRVVDAEFARVATKDPQGRFALLLIGCATYRIPGDAQVHQTPFAYEVYKPEPGDPEVRDPFRYVVGTTIDAGQLRLRELYFSGREPT